MRAFLTEGYVIMQDLFKQYLDKTISRAALLRGLSAAGLSLTAAGAFADALRPEAAAAQTQPTPERTIRGTGGTLFVQQLKAAGVRYYFFNPSTGDAPIFDAIGHEPSIQLIKGIQEGAVVAMCDGYARLSGKLGVCSVANVGLPNGMTQLVNAYKDRTSMLMVIASFGAQVSGKDGPQDYEHQVQMMQPISKWYWETESAATIPEMTRRALKFATTPPTGPVFLAMPDDQLAAVTTATVMDAPSYDAAMHIRPDRTAIDRVAKLLIEAKNPVLSVGDEVTTCDAGAEVAELAELLGLPVAGGGEFGVWSKPFPTHSPLYLGPNIRNMRFPGADGCAPKYRQPVRRDSARGPDAGLDASRSVEPGAQRAGRHSAGRKRQVRHGRFDRGRQEHGDERPPSQDRG